jgi:hypothetical protein
MMRNRCTQALLLRIAIVPAKLRVIAEHHQQFIHMSDHTLINRGVNPRNDLIQM